MIAPLHPSGKIPAQALPVANMEWIDAHRGKLVMFLTKLGIGLNKLDQSATFMDQYGNLFIWSPKDRHWIMVTGTEMEVS
jgi:hypothetical protein